MTITVKELIEQLAELPPDLEVLVASEKMGSPHFEAFGGTISTGYAEVKGYAHKFHQEEYYDVDPETGESDFPGENAVVLWPFG